MDIGFFLTGELAILKPSLCLRKGALKLLRAGLLKRR